MVPRRYQNEYGVPFAQITGPAAWVGPDLQREGGWLQPLSAAELGELEAAMADLKSILIELGDEVGSE